MTGGSPVGRAPRTEGVQEGTAGRLRGVPTGQEARRLRPRWQRPSCRPFVRQEALHRQAARGDGVLQ